jgi:hypothetical protein
MKYIFFVFNIFLYAFFRKNNLIIQDPEGQDGEVMHGSKKSSLPAHPAYHGRGNKQMNKAADSNRGHEAIALTAPTLLSAPC